MNNDLKYVLLPKIEIRRRTPKFQPWYLSILLIYSRIFIFKIKSLGLLIIQSEKNSIITCFHAFSLLFYTSYD